MPGKGNKKPDSYVRIIAGQWKGRRIPVAEDGVRPSGDRVRETVFNWLMPHINGVRCLDLFAGTGALGLEALSRGAAAGIFIEKNRRVAQVLRETLAMLGAEDAEVINMDAFSFLKSVSGTFELVFLDPPFDSPRLQDLCTLLEESGALAESALIYMEMNKRQPMPKLPPGWHTEKEQTAGQVRYALVRRTLTLSE